MSTVLTRAAAATTAPTGAAATTGATTTTGLPRPPTPRGAAAGGAGGDPPPPGGGGGGGGGDGAPPPPGDGAGDGAPPPPAADGAPVPMEPIFALTPSHAVGGWINYASRQGQRLYDANIAPLELEYDLDPGQLLLFLKSVQERATAANWACMFAIPHNGHPRSFFAHFGSMSLQQLQQYAGTYVGTPTRAAQDSMQAFTCLKASLTRDAAIRVTDRASDYTINGTTDGLCMLKVICTRAQVDTVATTAKLLGALGTLDELMIRVGSNVRTFNLSFNGILLQLMGRGEHIPDRQQIVFLFSGYLATEDQQFRAYMQGLKDQYEDGRYQAEPDTIMTAALNKYDLMTEAGKWQDPPESDKKMIALQAQVVDLQQKIDAEKKRTSGGTSGNPPDAASATAKGTNTGQQPQYPAWKKVPPTSDTPKENGYHVRTDKKTKQYWCPFHSMWTAHFPGKHANGCKKNPENQDNGASPPTATPPLRSNPAALAAIEGSDDDRSI